MKKASLLVVVSLAGLLVQSALATINFSVTTPQQFAAASGTFTVTLTLDVTQKQPLPPSGDTM